MPLIDNVIAQLGKFYWFKVLDLQSSFWQVHMAPEDMKKIKCWLPLG
jgi:TolB-like protein